MGDASEQLRLVPERADQGGVSPSRCDFFSAGYLLVFQLAIARSLRSRAFPLWRCTLRPILLNVRHTEEVTSFTPKSSRISAPIRCNTVCPGDIQTDMMKVQLALEDDPAMVRERMLVHYPLKRFATPKDVANVAIFLLSDRASYITGIDIVADGGLLSKCY